MNYKMKGSRFSSATKKVETSGITRKSETENTDKNVAAEDESLQVPRLNLS